jgi:hypothetical protein
VNHYKNISREEKSDWEVGVLAEHWKALRNEGTSMLPPTLFTVNDSLVISNLSEIGISLGDNEACVSGSLATIKEKRRVGCKRILTSCSQNEC